MNREVKAFISWAADRGWRVAGKPRSHIKLRRGQVVYTIPATPSDHRSLLNCKMEMQRLSGVRDPKPPAGRPRHGLPRRRQRFSMEAAIADRDRRVAAAQAASERLQELERDRVALRAWLAHRERTTRMLSPGEIREIAEVKARMRAIEGELDGE